MDVDRMKGLIYDRMPEYNLVQEPELSNIIATVLNVLATDEANGNTDGFDQHITTSQEQLNAGEINNPEFDLIHTIAALYEINSQSSS